MDIRFTLLLLINFSFTIAWKKNWYSDEYNNLSAGGFFKKLKVLEYSTQTNWDSVHEGLNFGRLIDLFNLNETIEVFGFQQQLLYGEKNWKSTHLRLINLNEPSKQNKKFDEFSILSSDKSAWNWYRCNDRTTCNITAEIFTTKYRLLFNLEIKKSISKQVLTLENCASGTLMFNLYLAEPAGTINENITVKTDENVKISIESKEYQNIFTIERISKNTFNIRNTRITADQANLKHFHFEIMFTSKSGTKATCGVFTTLISNDGYPFISKHMNRTLHQLKWDGLKPGSVLTTIRGYDREKAPYNKLTYCLPRNNNDLYGLVDLNSTSGVMTVRKELLSEKRSSIKGKVFIFDNGPLWVHRSVFNVSLVQKSLQAKINHDFEINSVFGYDNNGTFYLPRTMIENKVVFKVSSLKDEYKIKSATLSGTNDLKIKTIKKEENKYAILTNRNFTYLATKNWSLKIEICFDEGCLTKPIKIRTFSEEESMPVYKKPIIIHKVDENKKHYKGIPKSHAQYFNGLQDKIFYELINKTKKFEVSSRGIVKILKRLDREKQSSYKLLIKAYNRKNVEHYAIQEFIIKVNDINDNHPIFTFPSVNGKTYTQLLEKNKTVLVVKAQDPDTDLISNIWYCWKTDTLSEYKALTKYLKLGSHTGIISTRESVESFTGRVLSFNNVSVVAYETAENKLRKNEIMLSINLVKELNSFNQNNRNHVTNITKAYNFTKETKPVTSTTKTDISIKETKSVSSSTKIDTKQKETKYITSSTKVDKNSKETKYITSSTEIDKNSKETKSGTSSNNVGINQISLTNETKKSSVTNTIELTTVKVIPGKKNDDLSLGLSTSTTILICSVVTILVVFVVGGLVVLYRKRQKIYEVHKHSQESELINTDEENGYEMTVLD